MAEAYNGLVALIIDVLATLIYIYGIFVWAWVISSWLVSFNVINSYQPLVRTILDFLFRITQPALRPIQRYVPQLGGIDLSPFVLLLGLWILRRLLVEVLYPLIVV